MNNSSLPPRPVRPIVIPVEDEIIHTNERPFCSDVMCPCHQDPELNQHYFMQPYMDGLVTKEEAVRIWYGRQV